MKNNNIILMAVGKLKRKKWGKNSQIYLGQCENVMMMMIKKELKNQASFSTLFSENTLNFYPDFLLVDRVYITFLVDGPTYGNQSTHCGRI